jgi:hypothetical protein
MRTDDVINLLVQDLPTPAPDARGMLRRWLPLAALVAGGSFLALMGVRADLAAEGLGPTAMKLGLGALLAITAAAGAVRLSRPEATTASAAKWLIAFGLLLAVIVTANLASEGLDGFAVRLFGKSVLSCLTLIPMLAAVPLIATLLALRHGATTAPAAAGALAGLAAAGLAIVAYGLFCTEDSPLFVATWYTVAAGLAGLAGAILGRVMLRW